MDTSRGFREVEHTADWELQVWAPDLEGLLEQAARGMYAISGMCMAEGPRTHICLEQPFEDDEGLLVAFLSELLYFEESDQLAFDEFQLSISNHKLHADLIGGQILALEKEIKAVTYHHLSIRQIGSGLEVNIVFDV